MTRRSRFVLAWVGVLFAATTAGQSATAQPTTRTADATDSRIRAVTTTYRPVFDQYVPAMDDKPLAWRDANTLVGSIGGWRVYAREAQQSPPTGGTQPSAPANTAPPATQPSSTPHQKH